MLSNMQNLPRHVAIIMDGNGRWAKQRGLPRSMGHREGGKAVQKVIQACIDRGIAALSLWAFGTENWQRPKQEVDYLMELFSRAITQGLKRISKYDVQFRMLGELSRLPEKLQQDIIKAQQLSASSQGLKLSVAINYSGRSDIVLAVKKIIAAVQNNEIAVNAVDEAVINSFLATCDLPEPDLLIRTSGEQRISNFMLWQLAYTELYFTDTFWPDFGAKELDKALASYAKRDRRFGKVKDGDKHA